jgi:hypothetical protein
LAALGLAAARPIEVTQPFISGLPPGPELRVPNISGAGAEGPEIAGIRGRIGDVFVAADQHYVLLGNGLAPVGSVMLDLLLADDPTVTTIPAAAAAEARSATTFEPVGFPTALPDLVFADSEPGMLCLVAGPSEAGAVSVVVHERRPDLETPQSSARTGPDGTQLADAVHINGGRAALVRLAPTVEDSTPETTAYLVTDQGKRHALPREGTQNVLSALGYGGLEPMRVPNNLLALLPLGPALDPAQAGRPVALDESVEER